MATTINLSYEDTFNVFDYVTQERIGQIALMSDGWAAYRATPNGHIVEKRIGTYKDAELAVRAVDDRNKNQKRKVA
jgi:hypothetical protein